MKYIISMLLIVSIAPLFGQNQTVQEEGNVTYISSKNVYVKFSSTKHIQLGDTLVILQNEKTLPVLVVDQKSSSSTICTPVGSHQLKVGDQIFAKTVVPEEKPKEGAVKSDLPFDAADRPVANNDPVIKPTEDAVEDVLFKEKIKGRVSAATYNNFSDFQNTARMRYAFSFRGQNLNNTRWSVENYITFRHNIGEWNEVSANIADALKVYSLSVKYDFDATSSLTFGRKINSRFSSMGAIDGLQYEKGFGSFRLGAIAGTRPDFEDYGFNPNLLQFGAYVSHVGNDPSKYTQTTLGLVEQMNSGNTDRRFVYFQHSGQLAKNLDLFGSFEVDLFENINGQAKSNAQLTNFYASLRYRVSKNFRINASYDNRRNIIYYESYKNFIDQLVDDETRQGVRLGISHRASKQVSWGMNLNTRFQASKANPSQNVSGYITFNNVPFINARATIRANYLQTGFLDSRILSARFNRDLVAGKISAEAYYSWVDYLYKNSENGRVLHQNIGGAGLNFRVQKNLSLYLYYEGVFDNAATGYHRFNAKIIKRF